MNHSELIDRGTRSLIGLSPFLPKVEGLRREVADAQEAEARGYFTPGEDERVLAAFGRYLVVRRALSQTIAELEPHIWGFDGASLRQRHEAFALAYAAACLLIRSASQLIDAYAPLTVVHRKLDQGEPRFGVPRKQFTAVYRSLMDPTNYLRFDIGRRYAEANWDHLMALSEGDDALAEIVDILREERESALAFSKRKTLRGGLNFIRHAARRRRSSSLKNISFALFEMSGRVVSELRNPFHRKRVTPEVIQDLLAILQPGDVIVTRHDDAATNVFLPGFWPHAALYIGDEEERKTLGVAIDANRALRAGGDIRVLEARKDGVLFRALSDTLTVDNFTVIRPRLEARERAVALVRASTHEGKEYDFEFDFSRSDRLVCTELVYRAYHGIGEIHFQPEERAGRLCLSAEQLLDHAVEGRGFKVAALFGVENSPLVTGEDAHRRLVSSYREARPVAE